MSGENTVSGEKFVNLVGGWAGWRPTYSVQKMVKGASELKFGGGARFCQWYSGGGIVLRFLYEYFFKTKHGGTRW